MIYEENFDECQVINIQFDIKWFFIEIYNENEMKEEDLYIFNLIHWLIKLYIELFEIKILNIKYNYLNI